MVRYSVQGILGILAACAMSLLWPEALLATSNGILSQPANASVRGTIDVDGIATHPVFRKWQLDLLIDHDPDQAIFLAFDEEPMDGRGRLAVVDTTRYPDGRHTLRLRVVHTNLNYDEYLLPITFNNARQTGIESADASVQRGRVANPSFGALTMADASVNKASDNARSADTNASVALPTKNTHTLATRLDIPFDKRGPWIEIDLATQTLHAWEDDRPFMETSISSGEAGTPTVQGVFHVNRKVPSQRMVGVTYDLPDVQSVMYFFSNYAIHGAYWHDDFGKRVSHGCINMREDEAQALFNWAPLGTPVFIHE